VGLVKALIVSHIQYMVQWNLVQICQFQFSQS